MYTALCSGVIATFLAMGPARAAAPNTAAAAIARWAGSYDHDAFLNQPVVVAELQKLLGPQLNHVKNNLSVVGPIDLIAGALSVSGNAAHAGGEEEAVVCVTPGDMSVEAAMLSKQVIIVFAKAAQYDAVSQCIKDWITLANSHHVDRLAQPQNVVLQRFR